MLKKHNLLCWAVALCAVLSLPFWPQMIAYAKDASENKPTIPTVHYTTVGRIAGDSGVREIVKVDYTDALYIKTTRYNDLVPYLDGDGTPVTYEEFLERVQQEER